MVEMTSIMAYVVLHWICETEPSPRAPISSFIPNQKGTT